MEKSKPIKPTLVRLPDELKEWLKKRAAENFRSVNGEIVARLEESRKREQGS
jgi:hypothetical protein